MYNSDVNEIAKEMERIFASFEISTKSGRGVGITFTPVPRINALLTISSIPNIFDKVGVASRLELALFAINNHLTDQQN